MVPHHHDIFFSVILHFKSPTLKVCCGLQFLLSMSVLRAMSNQFFGSVISAIAVLYLHVQHHFLYSFTFAAAIQIPCLQSSN